MQCIDKGPIPEESFQALMKTITAAIAATRDVVELYGMPSVLHPDRFLMNVSHHMRDINLQQQEHKSQHIGDATSGARTLRKIIYQRHHAEQKNANKQSPRRVSKYGSRKTKKTNINSVISTSYDKDSIAYYSQSGHTFRNYLDYFPAQKFPLLLAFNSQRLYPEGATNPIQKESIQYLITALLNNYPKLLVENLLQMQGYIIPDVLDKDIYKLPNNYQDASLHREFSRVYTDLVLGIDFAKQQVDLLKHFSNVGITRVQLHNDGRIFVPLTNLQSNIEISKLEYKNQQGHEIKIVDKATLDGLSILLRTAVLALNPNLVSEAMERFGNRLGRGLMIEPGNRYHIAIIYPKGKKKGYFIIRSCSSAFPHRLLNVSLLDGNSLQENVGIHNFYKAIESKFKSVGKDGMLDPIMGLAAPWDRQAIVYEIKPDGSYVKITNKPKSLRIADEVMPDPMVEQEKNTGIVQFTTFNNKCVEL